MKLLLSIVLMLPLLISAQGSLPSLQWRDENIVYTFIDSVGPMTKDSILLKAKYAELPKGTKILFDWATFDKDADKLLGEASFFFTSKQGKKEETHYGKFKIELQAKDNRYRIILDRFEYEDGRSAEYCYSEAKKDVKYWNKYHQFFEELNSAVGRFNDKLLMVILKKEDDF